jgi:hypothetical protein
LSGISAKRWSHGGGLRQDIIPLRLILEPFLPVMARAMGAIECQGHGLQGFRL